MKHPQVKLDRELYAREPVGARSQGVSRHRVAREAGTSHEDAVSRTNAVARTDPISVCVDLPVNSVAMRYAEDLNDASMMHGKDGPPAV